MSKAKKKPDVAAPVAIVPDVLKNAVLARMADEEAQMALPVLYGCLVPQYDGSTLIRPAGKLSITVEGVYWRVQLDMPYERLTVRMFAGSLVTLLQDLNKHLPSKECVFAPMFERNKKPLPRLDKPIE